MNQNNFTEREGRAPRVPKILLCLLCCLLFSFSARAVNTNAWVWGSFQDLNGFETVQLTVAPTSNAFAIYPNIYYRKNSTLTAYNGVFSNQFGPGGYVITTPLGDSIGFSVPSVSNIYNVLDLTNTLPALGANGQYVLVLPNGTLSSPSNLFLANLIITNKAATSNGLAFGFAANGKLYLTNWYNNAGGADSFDTNFTLSATSQVTVTNNLLAWAGIPPASLPSTNIIKNTVTLTADTPTGAAQLLVTDAAGGNHTTTTLTNSLTIKTNLTVGLNVSAGSATVSGTVLAGANVSAAGTVMAGASITSNAVKIVSSINQENIQEMGSVLDFSGGAGGNVRFSSSPDDGSGSVTTSNFNGGTFTGSFVGLSFAGNGVSLTNTPAADVTNNFPAFTSLVFSGDSITFGFLVGGTNYPYFLTNVMGLSAPIVTNTAISGQTAAAISNAFAAQIGNFIGPGSLVCITVGKNDIANLSPQQIFSYLTNLWQRSRALGSYVCASTISPSWGGASSSAAQMQTWNDVNNLIRHASAQWDYLADWAYFCPSPAKHPEFYADGVTHPSIYGNGVIATNYYQVLQRPRHTQSTLAYGDEQNPFETVGALSNNNVAVATYQNPLPAMTGSNNFFAGVNAGVGATSADSDTFVGTAAGGNATSASTNTAVGSQAFTHNTTGAFNAAFGNAALRQSITDSQNSAFGDNALASDAGGSNNFAGGFDALVNDTTGSYNTVIGWEAAFNNTVTGYFDSAYGALALRKLTTGSNNTAIAYQALDQLTTGQYNTAVGVSSQFSLTTAVNCTSLGYGSLQNNIASNNIGIGFNSGKNLTLATSTNNIFVIPAYTGFIIPDVSNETVIGQSQTLALIAGTVTSSNGFCSYSTNANSGFTTTGQTNTTVNTIRLIGLTGTAVQWTNISSHVGAAFGTITIPLNFTLNPNEAVYGSSMAVITNVNF